MGVFLSRWSQSRGLGVDEGVRGLSAKGCGGWGQGDRWNVGIWEAIIEMLRCVTVQTSYSTLDGLQIDGVVDVELTMESYMREVVGRCLGGSMLRKYDDVSCDAHLSTHRRSIGTPRVRGLIHGGLTLVKYLSESENESWGDSDDDSNDDDSDDVSNDDDDDVDSDADGDNEASDSEKTDSDEDENPNLNQNDDEEE
ncbi:hypothetical protein Tco_0627122 [Tanacetum coccineum]|uniref:Uncharacterized protein n=1 Tax=Tanacetum coccineum TaxID=301880 RepID=A0ABQ4WLH8_9ASTR